MLVLSDRVKESSISSGSGNVVFNRSFRGFQSFADGVGHNNTTYYTIENGSDYEVGIGIYDSGNNSLSRNLVLESSNSDELVDLSGVSIVFCTYPAYHSVFLNEHGFISGQLPWYSGIALPDGTTLTTSIDGTGNENTIAYWSDNNTLAGIDNIEWNPLSNDLSISGDIILDGSLDIQNNLSVSGTSLFAGDVNISTDLIVDENTILVGDVDISGILQTNNAILTNTDLRDALFYRTSAGCFFHAYVDNATDNMVALYSSNETNPYWRLGIKSYTTNYSIQPTAGYVQAENGEAGLYATPQNYAVITSANGFWVGHDNVNVFNIQADEGVRIFNEEATATALTVRGASAQSNYLQEWSTYTYDTVASIDNDGQIAIDSVRFGDGTVQTTAVTASVENYKTVSSSTYLLPDDSIVFVNCSSNISLNLPTASGVGGKRMTIKRKAGYGENLLTVLPSGSELIDGDISFSIPYDNQAISLVSDNSNWYVI
jgi:hypothetical protein